MSCGLIMWIGGEVVRGAGVSIVVVEGWFLKLGRKMVLVCRRPCLIILDLVGYLDWKSKYERILLNIERTM